MQVAALARPGGKDKVTVIAHVYDTKLCDLLRDQVAFGDKLSGIHLVFFNIPESGAHALLKEVPPRTGSESRPPHLVVIGLGDAYGDLVEGAQTTLDGDTADVEQ